MNRIYKGEVPLTHLKPKPHETTKAWMDRTTRARQNFHNHGLWVWPDLGKDGRDAERAVKNAFANGETEQVVDL